MIVHEGSLTNILGLFIINSMDLCFFFFGMLHKKMNSCVFTFKNVTMSRRSQSYILEFTVQGIV